MRLVAREGGSRSPCLQEKHLGPILDAVGVYTHAHTRATRAGARPRPACQGEQCRAAGPGLRYYFELPRS